MKNIRGQFGSGQDGGIGKYTLPPHRTRRTTTNSKTQNNQNCQKIELYGSLTTKELKKKHSSRLRHNTAKWVAHPLKYLRIHPLQCNRCIKTKKYGLNERTDQSSKVRTK